jgi:hypothetical protein
VIKNAQGAAPFDRGRRAGLKGVPKRPNPYDHPERQTGSTMAWERRCSEWDEGWSAGNAELKEQQNASTNITGTI